jgi:RNA polymerase sigma factor FliA
MSQTAPIDNLELWQRLHDRDCQDARQALVQKFVRIVKYVAGRMAIGLPHYVEFNDLVSAGLLGLIQAIDNFDHQRGIKFETYAIPRIRGAILDELRSQDWFPRSLRRKAKQIEEAYATLEIRLGRPATDQELADALQVDVAELDGLLGEVAVATIMSLDAESSPEDSEQSTNLGEFLADPRAEDLERNLATREMRELIAARMAELPEKEQLVLVLYYYEELTLKEIGEILDVTESRVCQIHTKAVLQLRSRLQAAERESV